MIYDQKIKTVMKTAFSKVSLLLVVSFVVFSLQNAWASEKISRKVQKNFPIRSNGQLHINNQFGNVHVSAWDKKEVGMEITITVEGKSKEAMEKRLDNINLIFETQPDRVSVVTEIEKMNNSWIPFKFKYNDRLKFRIDYRINVPPSVYLDLSNKFGNIEVDKTHVASKIRCGFGQIDLGEFYGEGHDISLEFCKNSTIDYFENGKIRAEYSNLELREAKKLQWRSDFSKVSIQHVDELDYGLDYGRMTVEDIHTVEGSSDFATIRLGSIHKAAELKADFGSIRIKQLAQTMTNCRLETDFTRVQIGIAPDSNFSFTIDLESSGFTTDLALQYQQKIIDANEKYYSGSYGNPTEQMLSIQAEHGNVKLLSANNPSK